MWDLRLAIRTLRATPVVSAVAILSLALGIGANTAIFSILNSVLLRTLPVKDPGRLALLTRGTSATPGAQEWTYPVWNEIRQRRSLTDRVFAWSPSQFDLGAGGPAEIVEGLWVSGDFFEALGVPAVRGRMLTDADDQRGGGAAGPAVVISHAFWQRKFGGAADTIGRTLTLEGVPFTIVGVAPPTFFGVEVGRTFDVAVPFGDEPLIRGKESALDRRNMSWVLVMVRLRNQQSIDAGTEALRGVQPLIREATMPENVRPQYRERYLKEPFVLAPASGGHSALRSDYQRPLVILMGVVGVVLLIACANIANLLLARITARRHELSIRLALGASRWRLIRQLLAESVVLAGIGGCMGIAVASWGSRLLVQQLSTQLNIVSLDLSLDWRVLAFATIAMACTVLICGLAPAYNASRLAPMTALREHGPGESGDARETIAKALVVAQVALSLVLLVGAGLFVRTFASLAVLHLGFDRDPVVVVTVDAQRVTSDSAQRVPLYGQVREAVKKLPDVAEASLSAVTPVSGFVLDSRVQVSGVESLPESERTSFINYISPGWFSTFGTPLLAGRDVTDGDRKDSSSVVIVNQTFAEKFFDRGNALGHTISLLAGTRVRPPMEVVGIVTDAVYRSLRDPIPSTIYMPLTQAELPPFLLASMNLSIRSRSNSPVLLTRTVAEAIGSVNPQLKLTFRPLADQVNASLVRERIVAVLSGFFGALALILAGLGLYGVTSYSVTRRQTEIGIRMALGAPPASVVQMVLSRLSLLVVAGVVIGVMISLWVSKFAVTLLYGLEPRDPATLLGAATMLIAVSVVAALLPAWRAARIDPSVLLRKV